MTAEGGAGIPGRPPRGTDWPRARSPNPYTLRWRTPRFAGCACAPAASERGRRRATQSRSRVRACVCVCVCRLRVRARMARGSPHPGPRPQPAAPRGARPHLGCRAGAGARPTAAGSAPTSSPRGRPRAPVGWGSRRPRSPARPSQATGGAGGRVRVERSARSGAHSSGAHGGVAREKRASAFLEGGTGLGVWGQSGTERQTDTHGDAQDPKAAFPGDRSRSGHY